MWSKNGKEVLRDIEAHDLDFPEGTPSLVLELS
jgi:hypothetical protein